MQIVAHGSGIDELITFLSVPALFLIYLAVRKLFVRRRPSTDEVPDDPDEQRAGPAAR